MKNKFPSFFHYFLGIIFAGTTLYILEYYVHNAILIFRIRNSMHNPGYMGL